MPRLPASSAARATCWRIPRCQRRSSALASMRADHGSPEMRFITITGRPSPSRPTSWMGTMFGCSSPPVSQASRSRCRTRCGASSSGRRDFTATSRPTERCSATRTMPIPPWPRVRPTSSADRSSSRSRRGSRSIRRRASVSGSRVSGSSVPSSERTADSASLKVSSEIERWSGPSGPVATGRGYTSGSTSRRASRRGRWTQRVQLSMPRSRSKPICIGPPVARQLEGLASGAPSTTLARTTPSFA